jgi:uncharacterized UPF0160 family protein
VKIIINKVKNTFKNKTNSVLQSFGVVYKRFGDTLLETKPLVPIGLE